MSPAAQQVDVRALLADYAQNADQMPTDVEVTLRITATDSPWATEIRFRGGGDTVTVSASEEIIARVFAGEARESVLIARGDMIVTGSADAIDRLFDVLPPLGRLLSEDLEKGGHRFDAVRPGGSRPDTFPTNVTDDPENQLWVAARLLSRLSRTCQGMELETLIPHSSKFDFPGIDDPAPLLARFFACVGGKDPKMVPGRAAQRHPDDPQAPWLGWATDATTAKRPLRVAFDRVEAIVPQLESPTGP
jgi:hypothetical protein